MKLKEFITFRLSKFLTAIISAVLICLFSCILLVKDYCLFRNCSPHDYLQISCFLTVLAIVFLIVWLIFSLAKNFNLNDRVASILSIICITTLLVILFLIYRIILSNAI